MKKNWNVLALFLTLFLTTAVFAQLELGELPGSQQLVDTIQSLLTKLSFFAGGLFGLYVILLFVRMHYERKKIKLLEDLRNDVDKLTIHFGIKHAHPTKNIFKRVLHFFLPEAEEQTKKSKK